MHHVYRTCTFCDAHCGIDVHVEKKTNTVLDIRGDKNDPFSKGYICPKAYALKGLHEDPDRLRTPLVRKNGKLVPTGWDEALDFACAGIMKAQEAYSKNQIGFYIGNPIIHDMESLLAVPVLLRALHTRNIFTAASVDTWPKNLACAMLYGDPAAVAVPDIDRTDYFLVFGANPWVSNGSVMMAPDLPGRISKMQARKGKFVIFDPRRNESAYKADHHYFIKPGTDAYVLLSMIHTLFAENLIAPETLLHNIQGLNKLRELVIDFAPDKVAQHTGVTVETIQTTTREFANAERAICYGRTGTCTQKFGTLCNWAMDILNILTGNLDRPGGIMFPAPAGNTELLSSEDSGEFPHARYHTQVRNLPEFEGQFPLAALAEEIDSAAHPIKALITLAGNPTLSAPNGPRLTRALKGLDFMVSLDFYVNETTCLADVILPPSSPLERSNCDFYSYLVSVRNIAKFSPAALKPQDGLLNPWTTLFELTARLLGKSRPELEEGFIENIREKSGLQEDNTGHHTPPERVLDLILRAGPYGLNIKALGAHGIDLGPLKARLAEVIKTKDKTINLVHPLAVLDIENLRQALNVRESPFLLIGRRHMRSNNSWMHNIDSLAKGKPRCTLLIHPDDAANLGLVNQDIACLQSSLGTISIPVEICDDMMPGVVSLPHGFGHDVDGACLTVAKTKQRGVNCNALIDDNWIDALSGTAAFNGVPISIHKEL
jgi:anaerobic selenocysteine-containing dehydrogenase